MRLLATSTLRYSRCGPAESAATFIGRNHLMDIRKLAVTICLIAAAGAARAQRAGEGAPCDIYAEGGTPCVAAYSTTRALYSAYGGNLYQVRRADGAKKDIVPLSAGGEADASLQDAFCSGTTAKCRISIIYDQSGKGNHLTKAPAGSQVYGLYDDSEAVADALPISLNGKKVYGVHVTPGGWTTPGQVGYRNTATNGIAKGDDPESMYMVTDGNYVNGACCFDFGNAEMSSTVYGDMETIYFGTNDWWGKGAGTGPWVMGDLENGVYSMGGVGNYSAYGDKNGNKVNSQSVSFKHPFVTAYLKGNSADATTGGPYTLKGGNAQAGKLATLWDGAFPVGYSPRNRQGGIVLGVGGDNSSGAQGNFYEGVLTAGFASSAVDDAIQANIVAAGYGATSSGIHGAPASRAGTIAARWANGGIEVAGGRDGIATLVDVRGRVRAIDIADGRWEARSMPAGVYRLGVSTVDGIRHAVVVIP